MLRQLFVALSFLLLSACSGSDDTMTTASSPSADRPSDGAPPPSSPPPSQPPPSNPPSPSPPASTPGPWPVADLMIYDSAHGLTGTVIDAGPDEAQNIWVATPDTLALLRSGQTNFTRYTAADGLHILPFVDPAGQSTFSHITAVAGGRANEVFVGYKGFEGVIPPPAPPSCCVPNADFSDPRWSLGQADKVLLQPDGSLQVKHYEFRCDISFNCWENRSTRRMVFAHSGEAAGHLFVGMDHGVVHVFNDTFGDHIHVETWYHSPNQSFPTLKIGEQYGLFVLPTGELLSGGAYGVGLQSWNPDPRAWVQGRFVWAFTTYGPAEPFNSGPHSLDVAAGYREDNRGVAMTPDGTFWFASLTQGLAITKPGVLDDNGDFVLTYRDVPGLPVSGLVDLAADPDGTLWIVDTSGRLLRFDPVSRSVRVWEGVSGARRVVVDTTVTPRAVYVAMGNNGLAVIRAS